MLAAACSGRLFAQAPAPAPPSAPPPGAAAPAATAPAAAAPAATPSAGAAPAPKPAPRWTNSTELSLVMTAGNSDVQTFGLKNTLEYKAHAGRTRFRIDALSSATSDDPYLLVQSGLTFQPGETLANFGTSEVRPGAEPDVARFFTEGRYDGDLKSKATWNAGASWETNNDTGIVSRSIVFGGLGHSWVERDDLKFRTAYGLSYTDRVEEVEDPLKEERFTGVRLSTDFMDKWGAATVYDNDFTFNVSVSDTSDFNADLVQGVSVNMNRHLALKVSLQLTWANEPALEEVDVILRARLVDPDGIPGNGDEFYETVSSGGIEVTIDEDTIRKEKLDSTFRTSLQITF